MPLRIAHIAPVIYPVPPATYGGTERVIADLARAQLGAGHSVTIFGPVDCAVEGISTIGDYRSVAGYRAHMGAEPPPGLPAELEAQQLRDLLRDGAGFDVLHLHGSAHASGVCAGLRVPAFRTIHWRADEPDHIAHFAAFPEERVIAISRAQARAIPRRSLAGIVHHGIPADRFALSRDRRDGLVFIGRMTDQKRPDRAIALARAARMPLRLAGPVDPGNPGYFARVVEPELDGAIRHVGSIDDRAKQDFFGRAAALVFPIDWPEPFGLVMIEAMACGTPVIAWNRGSVPEIVEDGVTGIVVETMEEAIARLPEALALDSGAIRACFDARFTAARMAERTLDLYGAASGTRSSSVSSARLPSP